ncbi:MAG: O-antigen ligase family protein, partial [Chloroflexota bacterium]
LPLRVSHPNVVAGALEIALPVNIAVVISQSVSQSTRERSRTWLPSRLIAWLTCLLIAFGLIMTTSRGAWLALGVVAVGAALIALAQNVLKRYALPLALIIALLGLIVVVQMGDAFAPALDALFGAISAGNTAVSRLAVFRQAWGLVQDYYFTGGGLGTFAMVFSTYALLIDVPFLTHAHNLFLEIWIEQGLLGFVAFAWLIVEFYLWVLASRQSPVASRQSGVNSWLAWSGIAATTVMLLHGCVDVLLYSSRALPLLFAPMGLALASRQSTVNSQQSDSDQYSVFSVQKSKVGNSTGALRRRKSKIGVAILVALCLLLTAYCLLHTGNSLAALWYANLGSVAQTRAELARFPFPDWKAGVVRRSGDLSQAQTYFQQALSFDSGNVTANQRLGAIAAARKEYDAAQRYLNAAQQRDPMNAVTWRLTANTYLAMGLQAEACHIAEQAKTLGRNGAWMFPPPECATK